MLLTLRTHSTVAHTTTAALRHSRTTGISLDVCADEEQSFLQNSLITTGPNNPNVYYYDETGTLESSDSEESVEMDSDYEEAAANVQVSRLYAVFNA